MSAKFRPALTETCCKCRLAPEAAIKRCSVCRVALYCSAECQGKSWKKHKLSCRPPPKDLPTSPPPEGVTGVRLLGGHNRPFDPKETIVAPDHLVWKSGNISPLSQVVGVPILIHRETEEQPLETPNDCDLDNQAVTYMMIDPDSGFAPSRWQKNIGQVVVVRADQKPLTSVALELIWQYCDRVLNFFSEGEGAEVEAPLDFYKEASFHEFCKVYKQDNISNGIRVREMKDLKLPL